MKKLTAILLALALALSMAACGCDHVWMAATCETPKTCQECGETEGEANGHSMVEASCEEPRHCENCKLTEGEALGHTWLEATTEAPQTCENCGATEGERIITDPRFTTASTKDLHGKWTLEVPFGGELMGLEDFPEGASMGINLVFSNDGQMDVEVFVSDNFMDLLIQYTVDMFYDTYAAQGVDKEAADATFESINGITIQEYVEQEMGNMDYTAIFQAAIEAGNVGGVYYVQDGQLYTGASWDGELAPEDFLLEGDTLTLGSFEEFLPEAGAFTRVVE